MIKQLIKILFLGLISLVLGWFSPVQATTVNLSSEDELSLFGTTSNNRLSVAELSGLSPPENLPVLSAGTPEKIGAWETCALTRGKKWKKVELGTDLVDSWKALGDFPNLRKIPSNLEVLYKVKGRFAYPSYP